ncbi:MAG: hypothetical protein ACLFV8_13950 [Alphaproteobacteria bacterium]
MSARGVRTNQKTFSEWCGVEQKIVQRWIREGMPAERSGNNRVVAIYSGEAFNWLIERERRAAAGADNTAQSDRKYRQARARKMELEADRLAGNLVPVEEAGEAFREALTRVRRHVMQMPRKLATRLAGMKNEREIRKLIDSSCRAALTSAHEALKPYGAGEDVEPARRAVRGRGRAAARKAHR